MLISSESITFLRTEEDERTYATTLSETISWKDPNYDLVFTCKENIKVYSYAVIWRFASPKFLKSILQEFVESNLLCREPIIIIQLPDFEAQDVGDLNQIRLKGNAITPKLHPEIFQVITTLHMDILLKKIFVTKVDDSTKRVHEDHDNEAELIESETKRVKAKEVATNVQMVDEDFENISTMEEKQKKASSNRAEVFKHLKLK